MINVLLVDDEPAVGRYLRSLIDTKCEGFQVTATAENGRRALSVLEERPIDLVVTDIRMPVVDGLELARKTKERYPHVPIIIVSGYQDFEYARKALDTGVIDYLLKPVNLRCLQEVLQKVTPAVNTCRLKRVRSKLLQAMKAPEALSYTPERLYIALYRSGGLPLRFGRVMHDPEVLSMDGCYLIPLRDGKDQLLCAFEKEISYRTFVELVSSCTGKQEHPTSVLITPTRSVLLSELAANVKELCWEVDQLITPGRRISTSDGSPAASQLIQQVEVTRLIDCALQAGKHELLSEAFELAARQWQSSGLGLFAIEQDLRGYLQYITSIQQLCILPQRLEYVLDRIISDVHDYQELLSSVQQEIVPILFSEKQNPTTCSVPVLYEELIAWIDQHFSSNLTLSTLADRFRVSPSYVSKLLRKYSDRSFTDILTEKRIAAARLLLIKAPELPLKVIARRVGYQDQFYFSRVFKSVVGIPPSEYSLSSGDLEPDTGDE